MKRLLFLFVLLATSAEAESLKGGYPACLTENLFDQAITALNKNDERAWQYLLENGCIVTKGGIPVSVLDRTWTGKVKVRAYVGDDAVILWTNMENVQQ